ncbi:hypothetical protein ACP275_08G219200 [Erythranthe tilingii]
MAEAHEENGVQGNGNEEGGGGGKSYMCRQSSTRWTPTTEQIRILKELYYNNGVRSPTAEQIQRISAKLRQYGKIEGKNVFYWFQNHKARERQKKRFTSDHQIIPPTTTTMHHHVIRPGNTWKTTHQDHLYTKFSSNPPLAGNNFPSSSSSSTPGFLGSAHVGNYGSVAMEKSFRECSINNQSGGGSVNGGTMGQSFAWIGVDNSYPYPHPYPHPYPFLEKRKYGQALDSMEMEEQQIETLPLFPMHGDDLVKHDFNGWRRRPRDDDDDSSAAAVAGPMASLELTLNSYAAAAASTRFSTS